MFISVAIAASTHVAHALVQTLMSRAEDGYLMYEDLIKAMHETSAGH